jgi:hypothetical protein
LGNGFRFKGLNHAVNVGMGLAVDDSFIKQEIQPMHLGLAVNNLGLKGPQLARDDDRPQRKPHIAQQQHGQYQGQNSVCDSTFHKVRLV